MPPAAELPVVTPSDAKPFARAMPTSGGKRLVLRGGESLTALLLRAGAGGLDAAQAERLVSKQVEGPAAGTEVTVLLGPPLPGGARRIELAELRPHLGLTLRLQSSGDDIELQRIEVPVDSTPLRLRGHVGMDLASALGRADLPASLANSARAVLAGAAGELRPDDRFDLIVAARHAGSGERELGPLLYAGLDRAGGPDLQLVRSRAEAGRFRFVDVLGPASGSSPVPGGLLRPVAGAVTSGFGWRFHPLLRFPRYHRGIDIAAPRGTPVRAAMAGHVVGAGWAGGHGYRVQLAHSGAAITSYSHLSRVAVSPGDIVAAGATIGFVGSTGLSTGPHLHFEVRRDGIAVPPVLGSHAAPAAVSPAEVARARDQLRALLSREFRELAG
jgi:murein DD-endopeptidase MepM/ murein hydrolase activator NlpD